MGSNYFAHNFVWLNGKKNTHKNPTFSGGFTLFAGIEKARIFSKRSYFKGAEDFDVHILANISLQDIFPHMHGLT